MRFGRGIKDWPPDVKGSSDKPKGSLFVAALAFISLPFGVVAGVAAFLLHGYGVI